MMMNEEDMVEGDYKGSPRRLHGLKVEEEVMAYLQKDMPFPIVLSPRELSLIALVARKSYDILTSEKGPENGNV